ncbi:unnamed protein product [Phytophthora fragariaefolia]|uniref:Unnamed protein product n=1 Tax=Phytophthora fragariaefolia TaxID=1490495 RepID=A0A9W7D3M2_9STRA|nr:unnamed protein product [Phytophthora fragariaefolia]
MQRLRRKICALQTVVDGDSSGTIQDLRGQIDQQALEIADLNRHLDRICQERNSAEVACAHLEGEISRASDEIQDLQTSLADREREVDIVRDELSTTLGTLDRVRSDLQRAESTLAPTSQPSAGLTTTLRGERDAAITEARRITTSLDHATADLRQTATDRDAARAEILDLREYPSPLGDRSVSYHSYVYRIEIGPDSSRLRAPRPSERRHPECPPAKRSHLSPPPDRTPTPPPSDHADRDGNDSGSGREMSQEASGDEISRSSRDLTEIQDDGGELPSPERTPAQEDSDEHHTPEPSSSGREDQDSSASHRSSEGEEETEQSSDSTDDEILAARSRSRSEAHCSSVPPGDASQPIDLFGSASNDRRGQQNQQHQPPPSPESQHSAGQPSQQTPDRPPPPSPPSSPDSPPGTPPPAARPILTPPLFPVGNSLPGFDRIKQFTQVEVDPWPSRLLNQILQITGVTGVTRTLIDESAPKRARNARTAHAEDELQVQESPTGDRSHATRSRCGRGGAFTEGGDDPAGEWSHLGEKRSPRDEGKPAKAHAPATTTTPSAKSTRRTRANKRKEVRLPGPYVEPAPRESDTDTPNPDLITGDEDSAVGSQAPRATEPSEGESAAANTTASEPTPVMEAAVPSPDGARPRSGGL